MTVYVIIWLSYLVWIPSNMLVVEAKRLKRGGKLDPSEENTTGFFPIIPVYPLVFSFLAWMLNSWYLDAGMMTLGMLHLGLLLVLSVRGLWAWKSIRQYAKKQKEELCPARKDEDLKEDLPNPQLRHRRINRI
jgi:hypothetical protein